MNSFAPLFFSALLFCKHVSAHGMVPLLRNLPSEAASSASNVKPEIIMVNRDAFTPHEDYLISENQIGTITLEKSRKSSRVKHEAESLNVSKKKMKITPPEDNPSLDLRIEKAKATTGVLKPRPTHIVPYSSFFQSVKIFTSKTRFETQTTSKIYVNKQIMKLANKIQGLVLKLGSPFQSWDSWINANEILALECISIARHVLHKAVLTECERIWALGIVAALVKYIPSTSTKMLKELQNDLWKRHVYLEIQAAIEFEDSLTRKLRSLLSGHQVYTTDPGLEECFSRARLFKSYDEIRERDFPDKRSGIDEFVTNNLLDTKLPEEDESMKSMIRSFASFFKEVEIPSWEGTYGKAIFIYLIRYWNKMDLACVDTLLKWTETQFDLYRDLHFPFFKAKIKNILKKPEFVSSGIDFKSTYNEMIDTSQAVIGRNFFKLSDSFFHFQDFEDAERSMLLDRYKLMVISSLIHPHLKDLVLHSIGHTPRVIERLASYWLEKFPSLEAAPPSIFQYKYMPFRQSPSYFASAHRQLLTEYMDDDPAIEPLQILLQEIPLLSPQLDKHMVQKILSTSKNILFTHVDNGEVPKVYLMVLEAIHHVVRYSPGSAKIFVRQLYEDVNYRELIYETSGRLLDSGMFSGTHTETEECVLQHDYHTFLSTLREMTSFFTVWEFKDASKAEEHINKFANSLEEKVAPYSSFLIDNLPDLQKERKLWVHK